MSDDIKKKIDVVFIAGGKFHDIDFARLEILKLLAEDDRMKTRVFEDYSNLHAIENADFLITYTCDVRPTLEQQKALKNTLLQEKDGWRFMEQIQFYNLCQMEKSIAQE